MSVTESPLHHAEAPWTVSEVQDKSIAIKSNFPDLDGTAEHREFKDRYASQARQIAHRALESMSGIDDMLAYFSATVIAELATNALLHGGNLTELNVTRLDDQETVYVVAMNPAPDEQSTPGIEHKGEAVAEEGNDVAEHGRGLVMTDKLTNGKWGQRNVVARDGERLLVTYAILNANTLKNDSDPFDLAA